MSQRFAVVSEAVADFTMTTDLADRVLLDAVEWLDEDLLSNQRGWLFRTRGGENLTWKSIKTLAREAGIRAHGKFDGQPGLPDAAAARRAILFLLREFPDLNAIVLVRDQDKEPERRRGLEQARRQDHSGVPIVVGLAIVERECWLISGFEPLNQDESRRLEAERQRLGFDPCLRSHELTACKDNTATRSPKRVLHVLSEGDFDRERHCIQVTSLNALEARGMENGLRDFIFEIRNKLGPLLSGIANSPR